MIEATLNHFLKRILPKKTIWIAYSGGVDSHVLLHAINKARLDFPDMNLKAIHINHQLMPDANCWQEKTKSVCEQLDIPFFSETVQVKCDANESLEECARLARHKVFKSLLEKNDVLLTAHHQNDQAETLFLQLLRGAGVRGLGGMREMISMGKGVLMRPFLSISRDNILAYAREEQLVWIEDLSNSNEAFSRNFLRKSIIPLLSTRWPKAAVKLSQSAIHLQEAQDLLEEVAKVDLTLVLSEKDQLSLSALSNFSIERQKNLLRFWITRNGFSSPSSKKLTAIMNEVIHARIDATPCVTWGNAEIRRYQDHLYIMPALTNFDISASLAWDITKPLPLPSGQGLLEARPAQNGLIIRPGDKIEIRFRQGGEACYLAHRTGQQSLKKLFQEWGIPPWLRDRLPLLFINNELKWIAGHGVCSEETTSDDCYEIYHLRMNHTQSE